MVRCRRPWLDKIAADLKSWADAGESGVVACSALKRSYRDRLRASAGEVAFVHLRLGIPQLRARMQLRKDHYMPDSLIESQFEALQIPGDDEACLEVDAAVGTPDEMAEHIVARLHLK